MYGSMMLGTMCWRIRRRRRTLRHARARRTRFLSLPGAWRARPTLRFVPVKMPEPQTVLLVHRARAAYVKARTAQATQMRGLSSEFGIVLPAGIRSAMPPHAGHLG